MSPPWKKTIYKSVLLSFALVVTMMLLQKGNIPNQFFQSQPQKSVSSQEETIKTQKRGEVMSLTNNFWKKAVDVPPPAVKATEKVVTSWDVAATNCTANLNFTREDWFKSLEPHFQQFLFYRHCRYFPILINHPEKCSSEIDLLVVVKSVITQHDRREAIRRTWGQERVLDGKKIKTLFLLGVASKEEERPNYQKLLEYEDRIYGDILQWDFLDTFFNLTLKEVHFLKWFNIYCHHVRYIFKGDDDVFVSPENILEFLKDQKGGDLFVGDVLVKAKPIRKKENKYYIPDSLYSKTYYPPYAGGGGFVMDGPLAKRLHKASENRELYPIDDVYLGMCLEDLKVAPVAHTGFKTFGLVKNKNSKMNREPCFYKSMLVVHKLQPPDLLNMWDLVHKHLSCSQKANIL
ncbi:UDP-GlcNAc:betaGal beta-1,3-N-acetylglucosaminyltransferase 7-like isoform X1 [Crotalus tigris]|uniref:UDP-GlcNAc:betaGal beta-1,3-N-acetylglucosaminyltransferase 7-like isoform X1 n=2 Tax=Crotalus tigris TaxID=88082 RepID=UPI00192FB00F|nr:UDP-GlcNAc:betaGal beta-1,3-N-acetylglucosaminyltransferase 7-like isoform X1 [Crotalus tigris]